MVRMRRYDGYYGRDDLSPVLVLCHVIPLLLSYVRINYVV